MFNRTKTWLKDNQPIHLTGILLHTSLWLNASMNDTIVRNPNYIPSVTPESDTVILTIHGTADRESSFKLVSERIIGSLPASVSHIHRVAFKDRAKGKGIPDFVEQLREKINLLGYKKIILCGHSRGCLFSADYAENFSLIDGVQVLGIFAVCGPFGGSAMAIAPGTLISESVDQMQIGSQYLTDLCAKIKVSTIPYFYYAAKKDVLVSIGSSCIPEHRQNLVVFDRHGHLSILSSHRLVKDMLGKINTLLNPRNAIVHDDSEESSLRL